MNVNAITTKFNALDANTRAFVGVLPALVIVASYFGGKFVFGQLLDIGATPTQAGLATLAGVLFAATAITLGKVAAARVQRMRELRSANRAAFLASLDHMVGMR